MERLMLTIMLLAMCWTGCNAPDRQKDTEPDGYSDYDIADPDDGATGPKLHVVEIAQMKFVPEVLRVSKGDTVVWVNRDIVAHDVTEQTTNAWTSSGLPAGASWKSVITESQSYYCSIHMVMKGRVIVDGNEIAMTRPSGDIAVCK